MSLPEEPEIFLGVFLCGWWTFNILLIYFIQ